MGGACEREVGGGKVAWQMGGKKEAPPRGVDKGVQWSEPPALVTSAGAQTEERMKSDGMEKRRE